MNSFYPNHTGGFSGTTTTPQQHGDAASAEPCICDREKTEVFCQNCGHSCSGRVRMKCARHPKRLFLDDLVQCVKCKSQQIEE